MEVDSVDEILIEKSKQDMKSIHFTLTVEQHDALKKIKQKNFVRILYMLRLGALYATLNERKLRKVYDQGYCFKKAKHYRVTLKKEMYEEIEQLSQKHKISKSRIMRIGINEFLRTFYKEEK